jgi:hypothetical protein
MSDANSEAQPESGGTTAPATPDLAGSLAGVIDAALGVGVSLARVIAEATALGQPVAPLPTGTPALQAIVRYGVTALGNMAQAVLSGAQTVRKAAPGARPATAATAAPDPRSAGPRVRAGDMLRVPLSVENPGDRVMPNLRPVLRAVRRTGGADASALLGETAVSFTPTSFDVAPHDFEKLTVLVTVPADMPDGGYELTLALGVDEPDLPLRFTVLPPAP